MNTGISTYDNLEDKIDGIVNYVEKNGGICIITDYDTAMAVNVLFCGKHYEDDISISLVKDIDEYLVEIEEGKYFCIEKLVRDGGYFSIEASEIIIEDEIFGNNISLIEYLNCDELTILCEEIDEKDNYCDCKCRGALPCVCDECDCEYKEEAEHIADDVSEIIDYYSSILSDFEDKTIIKDILLEFMNELDGALETDNEPLKSETNDVKVEDIIESVCKTFLNAFKS
ncbi:hypothetical protein [Clostridium tagluense]|uniref:Uncharacterized protein n=1 Tax=Clostridium tagluense TaxID=360422 RepID=A0A401ULL5_9CLOT|nr:hypothetical protein [Clostridium tagluense]GCD10423.1 hypothetical protein Ctaglu_20460 [Clostridium tagluense]